MARNQLILSAFFFNPQGDHRMSWRHPRAPGREVLGFDYYRELVQAAERARIDTIFVADHVSIWDSVKSGVAHYANARLEPLTRLSALAAVTKHIGLITTASSSYSEPYNVARLFASLDHISQGRASWNVVTSAMDEEARNFGRDGNIEHAFRYQRAVEFLDIVKGLWDSWEDEALLFDKDSGYFADPDKVHVLDHRGAHFKVRGPLNVSRPPQGHPLIVQAGSSEDGKNFATAHADAHFAIYSTREDGIRYREDINDRLARHGRRPESFKILPGILPIVAASEAEARDRQEYLQSLLPDRVGIDLLSSWSGIDLSVYPPDGPLPPLPDESTFNGGRTSLNRVKQWATQNLTLREIARKLANSGSVPTVAGTPKQIADQLQDWFEAGAADGFNLMFPLLPEDWINFAEQVVPELQRRGVFPTEYAPGTLRDRFGLARPANRFAEQRASARAVSRGGTIMTAAPRLQPREATAPQLINVLHSPKRIRVKFGGRVIADSRNVLVLRSNHFLPIYFFPLAAIDQSVLKPSKQGQQHPVGGETKYWDIDAGDRRAAAAAWSFTAPPDENLAPLAGRIAFTWNLVDQWFEEEEEVFVHARDPYARIDVLQSSSHVTIWFDGELIADSRRPVLLFETHLPTRFYLPQEDVRLDRLRASLTRTRCPYKGIASYWSGVLKDGSLREDVAWSYRDPIAEMPKIKGLIAFYPQAVDRIELDGQPV